MASVERKQEGQMVGVILAAGRSERFGQAKQLLPLGDTTLLGQVVKSANDSMLDRVVVVLGRAAAEVEATLTFGRAVVVDNTAYPSGCASSLLAGLDAAGDADALMLLLGDQPGVRTDVIDRAARDWQANRSWVAVMSYRGELGHPFVFERSAFGDLRQLHGDKAVWKLIESQPERVRRVPIDLALPADVDTPEDYQRLLADWTS